MHAVPLPLPGKCFWLHTGSGSSAPHIQIHLCQIPQVDQPTLIGVYHAVPDLIQVLKDPEDFTLRLVDPSFRSPPGMFILLVSNGPDNMIHGGVHHGHFFKIQLNMNLLSGKSIIVDLPDAPDLFNALSQIICRLLQARNKGSSSEIRASCIMAISAMDHCHISSCTISSGSALRMLFTCWTTSSYFSSASVLNSNSTDTTQCHPSPPKRSCQYPPVRSGSPPVEGPPSFPYPWELAPGMSTIMDEPGTVTSGFSVLGMVKWHGLP